MPKCESQELKFGQKLTKIGLETAFLKKMDVGFLELQNGLKKGVLRSAHTRTTFQCE